MTEAVAGESPAVETPVVETPVVEAPVVETPVVEAPVIETPVVEAPVIETPVIETPVVETPVIETPVIETPVTETPTQVDGPTPDTDETVGGEETPTEVDGPLPDTGGDTGGATDEETAGGDDGTEEAPTEETPTETPTQVDGPTPDTQGSGEETAGGGDDDPGTPTDTETETETVTDTGGSTGGGSTGGGSTGGSGAGGGRPSAVPPPAVETPVAPVEVARPTSNGRPVRPPAPVAASDSDDVSERPSLRALVQSVLGGGRTPAPPRADSDAAQTPAATPTITAPVVASAPVVTSPVAVAPVAVAPVAVAPVAVAPVAVTPVTVAPPVVAPPAVATKARVAPVEPTAAKKAPHIELSSGGSNQTYRQYEITALGLTRESRQVANALGFRILSERKSPLLGGQIVARLRTPSGQTANAALARIRSVLPEMTFDYSHLYRPSGEDGSASVRYAAAMIGAPAGDAGACSASTRVGLIDSGVGAHPTLASARIVRKNFIEKDAATNVTHGTAIASILVGDLPGSGPLLSGGQLYSANVFAQDRQGLRADPSAIIEALDWMAANRVPVVNLSLMGPENDLLTKAIRAAAQRGLVLVAAAGNDGPGGAPAYPAAYAEVIAVSAVDSRGRPYARNNRGGYVYVAAPGVDVWGADARGGLAFWTGTSFAAPFVTASIARDLAQGRVSDINDGRRRLASTARDMGAPGRDPIYGFGLLQLSGCAAGGVAPVVSSKSN